MGGRSEQGGRRLRTGVFWVFVALVPILYFLFVPVASWYLASWFDSEWLEVLLWPAIQLHEHSPIYEAYVSWLLEVLVTE